MGKDQSGFTLVELIIAVAILAIVMSAVCGFMIVGSRSYTSVNMELMLQQEAQLTLNRITDIIIDATGSINYGDGERMVFRDSEFGSEPAVKVLVVVNQGDEENPGLSYRFDWNREEKILYFNTSDTPIDEEHSEPVFKENNRAVLAEHVREFQADISQLEESGIVKISMVFEDSGREYRIANNVAARNAVGANRIVQQQ